MNITNSHIILISGGNVMAFKQMFEVFYPSVCIYARKYVKEIEISKDFAQEAFVSYWNEKEKFSDIIQVKAYIYKVTRHKCLNHIKSTKTHENILSEYFFTEDFSDELILTEETYVILYEAINTLAPQSRRIILLSLYGNKNKEIAEELNISIDTVKTLKKNAYKKLRIQLKSCLQLILLIDTFLK